MRIAFDHIALAMPRIADVPEFLVGQLGGLSGFGGPSGAYRWWHWDYPEGGRIEVIEPDGPPGGFVQRYLDKRGPGIHHATFKVPSLSESCERAERLGYEIVGFNDSSPHWREAFLHPKQAMGIVIQMVEAEPHDGPEEFDSGPPPPEPPSPPPPVTVVGLRMRSGDRARALRQWGEILAGEPDAAQDELSFYWPGSGMRVAVTIERGAPDSAEAIELRADRELGLSREPHPLLGARFCQLPT